LSSQGVVLDPDFGVYVDNDSGLPTREVIQAGAGQHALIAALVRWGADTQLKTRQTRSGGLFERDRYITPTNVFDQMKLAYEAAEADDVVSGVLEATESLAFSRVSFYADDPDEEDVYNQIAADIDLDSRLREMWRELFTVSTFVAAIWWHTKTYKVRGKTDKGTKRKKEFTVRCPNAITLLDPLSVVPVGSLLFNQEKLAYIADREEGQRLDAILKERDGSDKIVERLFLERYEPKDEERRWLASLDIATDNLFLLNPANVFRHTATRPQYRAFANVRLRSIFEVLDLKAQLRQMDRAHLIGGTNFIVVITKGTDQLPAKPAEIANLQVQVRTVARLPVLVGDHRLNVEIVTPKLDNTLKAERYNTLNSQITSRLYLLLASGAYQSGTTGDDSTKLGKVIARGLESRRHMLRRTLERHIFDPLFEQNDALTTDPRLRFHPRSIDLSFDPALASFLLDLRDTNELSRETILAQFDMDQSDEARMVERERDTYDDIFRTTVPFDAPDNNLRRGPAQPGQEPQATPGVGRRDEGDAGRRQGGRRGGGGAAPGTGQGQKPRRPRRTSD
jgi:hypothetical protein